MNKFYPFIFYCFFLFIVGGCAGESRIAKPDEQAFEIEKEHKRGPVTLTLRVNKKEITIAERLHLEIEVKAEENYDVKLPEFGEKLEQFGIADYSAPSPRLGDKGMVIYKKSYALEPFLSGEYIIPPMKVTFRKKEGKEIKDHELESEPITIQIKSLLPENMEDLTIEEIMPPMEKPVSVKKWLYGVVGFLLFIIIALAVFFYWRKRGQKSEDVDIRPAHEIAYEGLERLLDQNLIEKGEFKFFYLHLSNILRHYIENRFSLRAPERTTEEFLYELRSTQTLIPKHKEILKEFLVHCDMVKFAEHLPGKDEIQKTFDTCKQFIGETEFQEGLK